MGWKRFSITPAICRFSIALAICLVFSAIVAKLTEVKAADRLICSYFGTKVDWAGYQGNPNSTEAIRACSDGSIIVNLGATLLIGDREVKLKELRILKDGKEYEKASH